MTQLVSSEKLAFAWLETRNKMEMQFYSDLIKLGHQVIAENNTADTLLLAQNGYDLSKIISLLNNPTFKDDTLIAIKLFMTKIP